MIKSLSELAKKTVLDISKKDPNIAKSVARYFMDIDQAIKVAYTQLNDDGIAFFVIGNTKYFGVEVNNAKFIADSMLKHNFLNVNVKKHKISSKILTSFRDEVGKFTSSKDRKEVYSYEYIVSGEKGKSVWT